MKHLLYIFNSKYFFLGVVFGLILITIASSITEFFIKKSNHRLSKIFSDQKIKETIFFIGNSRSVPFNSKNLENSKKILNLSQNSMNSFQVENIMKAVKLKQKNKKIIFIELTSIIDEEIQCQYSIFYNLKFYFGKSDIKKECKVKFFLEKYFPISKINNELFYRIIYYYFFPEKDQQWTNNYNMPKEVCKNPKTSHLMKHFFSENSLKKMFYKANILLDKYSDSKTEIFYFISPVYQIKNYPLDVEKKFLEKKFKNLILINTLLNDDFFKNCKMYADTLHLTSDGINNLNKNNIFKILKDY